MKTLNRIFMGLVATVVVASGANNRQSIKKELVSSSFSSGVTTLNWVIKYDTNTTSPLKDVVIKDTYSSSQTYTPSTEAHPNGWSVTQNPSGFTWETSNGFGYSKPFPKPFAPVTAGSGTGDGYAPITYTSLGGEKRVYYINHHAKNTDLAFGCIGDCDNSVTWPMRLPDGDPNSSATSGTSNAPETVIINRKLYYPVSRPTDAGIGCFDLETSTECGYLQLAPYSSSSSERSVIDGLSLVGSNTLVIMDKAGKIYKVNVASNGTMSLSASYDATTVGMRTDSSPHSKNGKYYGIGSQINGDKVYFVKGHISPSNNRIMCYDSTANSICSGWGSAKPSTSIWSGGMNTYFYYNSSMTPTAICLSQSNYKNWAQQCFDLATGAVVSKPDIFPSGAIEYATGFEVTKGTKSFIPSASKDSVWCHDWTGATCPTPIIYSSNSENLTTRYTQNYGIDEDSEGCMWVYSDKNKLWSFDPETGAVPCIGNDFIVEDTYDASKNWCASKGVKWSYNQFKITGITPGEFSDLNITFYDANGAVISTESIPTNSVSYSKGLSTGVFASNIPIHYKIEGTRSGSSNPNATTPVVTISVDGPPREFCFQTTIPCPITGEVYNNATVGLKDAPAIDGRDEVVVDGELVCKDTQPEPPKQCLSVEPKLTCSKAGWRVELNSFTPANYSASNTDISVLAPSSVTTTKWGGKWYLNGANAGDTIRLNLHGADTGAGKFKDGDLCCDGEVNVTIPQDQNCTPSYPEINVMKSYKDGVFKLHLGLLGEVDAPQVLTIIDRVPVGITITGIDPRSTSSWACSNSFPVSGSANLVCGYIGSMPVSGTQELFLTATIDSKESVTNCMDVGIIQSDGTSIYIDPQQASCVTVDDNQTDDNNTENNSTGCQTDADCPSGYCHQGMCIIPDDGNNTNGGTDDNGTTGADVPLTCSSNIIIVADESGSIAEAGAISNVKDAIRNLVKGYKGNGSKAAVIHFSNNAQLVKPMTTIETAGVAPNQENAFTIGYNPTVGQTNWEAGLKEALNQVNANPGPEIVFFITDGQPNKYLDANGNVQSGSEAQSVAEAVAVANQINSSGGRIVAIGVGDISSSATAQSNLNQIASSNEDAIVGQTSDLNSIIGEYVTKSCSDILLRKSINYTYINLHNQDISSIKPIVTLSVTNSSPSNMTNIVVEDALPAPKMTYNSVLSSSVGNLAYVNPNKLRWTIPTLAPNATATAKFKVNLSAVAGDKIKNYAQVVSLDQSVASTPNNLANPITGPLNLSDKDEGYTETRIVDHNTTGGSGCDPTTSPNKCLLVTKKMKSIEGNCMPGHQCVYDVSIQNYSNVPYTGNINITDSMAPASLGANITVTANGSAPTPICSPNSTAIPFSCVQSTDLPAHTIWSYTITMSSVPQGAVKNCFKAGASTEKCFNFPSPNKSEPKPNIPVIVKPDVKPKPIIDKPKPVDEKPKPLIVVPRGNLSLYKRGPKVCKAGGICTFTITVKNRGRGTYTGPATVQDKSREFRGKLIRTRGKGWRCRSTRGGYVCNNPKLRLRAGASSQIKLSIRIPKRAKGYLTNCAKLDVLQGSNRVRAIQTMLLAAGYNTGGVNGSMNKKTIRALKAYARANGLKGKRAQRVAIKRLLAKYPFIRSKNSCVKVKIKEAKPECKRGQHFNGKQCVTCPRGSYWDKKHRRCVAKQVVKTCPRGYVLYKNRCYKEQRRSECPQGQEIDRRTGTCKKKLDVGTVLNIINVVGNIIGGGGGGKPDKEPHHKGGI